MQQHVGAVEVEHPVAVVPRLLGHPRVGMHERREAAELQPADEQLGRAALHELVPQVTPDVMGEVGDRAAGAGERRDDEHAQRPEVRHLVPTPGEPGGVLAGPAAAPEQHPLAGVDLVECPLEALAVHPAERPRRLGAGAPVGERHPIGDVVAIAVVGLDPGHAEVEHPLGRLAPPRLRGRAGEVHHRAGAHPPFGDERLPGGLGDEVAGGRRRGVVGRRLGVQALGRRLGRDLAVARVEVDPGRDPDDGADPVGPHPRDHPVGVGELVRVEPPGVVLRRPRRVDHDRVQRDGVAAKALVVVDHVVLVLVDVPALPEAVAPLGQLHREPGEAAERAEVGRRRPGADDVEHERAGVRPGRHRDPLAGEVKARAVGVGAAPDPVPPARQHPRHGSAVTLGHASLGEHLGGAVGPGVAAVGAELDVAPGLVKAGVMAQAQSDQMLLGPAVPVQAQAQRVAVGVK